MSSAEGASDYGCKFYNINYVSGPSSPDNISFSNCQLICSRYGGISQYNGCASARQKMIVNSPGNGWCLRIMECTSSICRCRKLLYPV